MSDQLEAKVIEYIEVLASQLGVATEYLFKVLVRQAITEGIVYTLVGLALLTVTVTGFRYIVKYARRMMEDEEDYTDIALALLFPCIALVLPTVGTFAVLPDALLHLFNPEFYAFKTVLEVFK